MQDKYRIDYWQKVDGEWRRMTRFAGSVYAVEKRFTRLRSRWHGWHVVTVYPNPFLGLGNVVLLDNEYPDRQLLKQLSQGDTIRITFA